MARTCPACASQAPYRQVMQPALVPNGRGTHTPPNFGGSAKADGHPPGQVARTRGVMSWTPRKVAPGSRPPAVLLAVALFATACSGVDTRNDARASETRAGGGPPRLGGGGGAPPDLDANTKPGDRPAAAHDATHPGPDRVLRRACRRGPRRRRCAAPTGPRRPAANPRDRRSVAVPGSRGGAPGGPPAPARRRAPARRPGRHPARQARVRRRAPDRPECRGARCVVVGRRGGRGRCPDRARTV